MDTAAERSTSPSSHERMVALLTELAPCEGFTLSRLPSVGVLHATRHYPRTPVVYEPCICIVAQGHKVGTLGLKSFVYDANHYLTVTVPLPFECETFGSPDAPLLGLSIKVTPAMVMDLLMQMDGPASSDEAPQVMEATPLDEPLAGAAVRLLECLRDEESARILGPAVVREIVYRVLHGPCGGNLRALAASDGRFSRIARILQRLHTDYARPHDVEVMARDAGMSASSFHTHFKAVTSSSPLQYLKAIRLDKARQLMVNDGLTAAEAATRVGYESASQFSREFRRFFGDTPAATAAQLRAAIASPAGRRRSEATLDPVES